MTDESRFLLVVCEGGLHASRYNGLSHAIKLHPGVVSVTNLAGISRDTLDVLLLKPEPVAAKKPKRRSKAA